ncbi:germination protein YpeB [Clostridium ganghwense]|uniref:Germination protein YpeB n=1 Tax=Clostridium ganghwense TaxID=312089 RepID=A0ABT4CLC1_9CLOT|nr:germination protein YpeB [Clostridium ganghwense]MCY6369846.1 germination protein YpeB [Clostridium ganghwense]
MKMSKKRIIYTIAVAFIVVFSSTFAILMTLERMDYRNYLQGEYSKNMHQLIDAVRNIKVDLTKSAIVGSREQSIVVFGNIFRYSSIANDKIHSLPISQEAIEGTSRFLSQVGDFSYSLAKVSSQGKELSEDDYKNIETLKNEADYLLIQLNEVQAEINKGKVKWGEIRKKAGSKLKESDKKLVTDKFAAIQKQVVQYPALIYDGPFSDNILEISPRITSQKEITEKEAIDIVKNLLGKDKVQNIQKKKGEGKTRIPAYSFDVTLKGREKGEGIVLEVSKNGGEIIYLLDNKNIGEPKMDVKKAVNIGNKYLKDIGYANMESTYTLKSENSVVISYVYTQGDIPIYPDQIKLKVALDNGSVIGIEAEKYLVSHIANRDIAEASLEQSKAQQKVGKKLNISSVRLSVIPTEDNKEVLCYEFSGTYNDDSFIVYINANTGFEQRIIQIINTPNGELTI